MRKSIIVIVAALMLSAGATVRAQELSNEEKVICNLAAKNCLGESEAIQKRIRKLKKSMDEGKKTYSPEDIKKLEQKLKEAQEILDKLEGKPAAK